MHLDPCADPFQVGMVVLNVPETADYLPFDRLLKAAFSSTAQKRTVAGRDVVIVDLGFDRSAERKSTWTVEIHFDPSVNYLIRRTLYKAKLENGGILRREEKVLEFHECAPGLYFPAQIAGNYEVDAKPWTSHTAEITDLKVNQPLPKDIFDLRFPHGITMVDTEGGVSYRVDPRGRRISEASPLGAGPPPPPAAEGTVKLGQETAEEPRPLTAWILPISVVLIALTVTAGIVKRWRASR